MPRTLSESVPGADPDRGALALDHYPEVTDAQAGTRTRALYVDIQRSMRLPFVNGVFRSLANRLEFLEAAWAEVGPFVRTKRFERDADRLRGAALLRPIPTAQDLALDIDQLRGAERIHEYTDTVHYALPKILLAAALIDLTLVRSPARRRKSEPQPELPGGPAPGTIDVRFVRPKKLRGARRELLEEIRTVHGHPFVPGFYRGVAHWPLVLEAMWAAIKPSVGTGRYVDLRRRLAEDAYQLASKYAVKGIDLEAAALEREDVAELRDLLSLYRVRIIPDVLIDATLVKSILDGGTAATRSRFSAAPTTVKAAVGRSRPTRRRSRARPVPARQRRRRAVAREQTTVRGRRR